MSADDAAPAAGWLRQQAQRLRPRATPGPPVAERPPRIAIVTDAAAALPPRWVAATRAPAALQLVPMPLVVGAAQYSDDDAELEAHLALALASGGTVSTSRPSPGLLERAYQAASDAGYDAVVSIHLSAALSGTVDAARLAAGAVTIPVHVLDSGTVGMAQGAAVQAAVAAARQGATVPTVLARAGAAAAGSAVFFYVPSLEQLRRGGRIGLASSWVGTVLDIKPLLGIRDGKIVPIDKVRTAAKAVARLEALTVAEIHARDYGAVQLSLHHFGNEEQAQQLAASIREQCPELPAIGLTRLPAVLAAHTGLGVLVSVISDVLDPPQLSRRR